MRFVIITLMTGLTFAANFAAANELHVVDENGDVEIFIPKSENKNSTTYIPSGIYTDKKPETITIIETQKPTVKSFEQLQPAAQGTAPMYIDQNQYQPLVDVGGNYDAPNDVYRPKLQFKSY